MYTLQSESRDSIPANQARNSSKFRTGTFSDFGCWVMVHSGAHVALTGSTFQASQPLMKRLVVFRMLVASWEDMLGGSLLVSL